MCVQLSIKSSRWACAICTQEFKHCKTANYDIYTRLHAWKERYKRCDMALRKDICSTLSLLCGHLLHVWTNKCVKITVQSKLCPIPWIPDMVYSPGRSLVRPTNIILQETKCIFDTRWKSLLEEALYKHADLDKQDGSSVTHLRSHKHPPLKQECCVHIALWAGPEHMCQNKGALKRKQSLYV